MADNSKYQPELEGSPPTTEQGGSQLKTPTADLPMRAIKAAEEMVKALKQFRPPIPGKEYLLPTLKIYPSPY